ncbi:MAG: hypothetical protein PHU23_01415 [Dehalococcoidales bacterium]|nr:hypothetical protein [Dehalococcoidales bacterium]
MTNEFYYWLGRVKVIEKILLAGLFQVWSKLVGHSLMAPIGDLPVMRVSLFPGTHYTFALEVKAAKGAVLHLQRTTPAYLDPVVNLR